MQPWLAKESRPPGRAVRGIVRIATTLWPVPEKLLVGLVMLLTLAHGLPNLAFNPAISWDEGYILQGPLNLLRAGIYGTSTVDGAQPFDPYLSTGPTVLLPIFGSFLLLGDGVAQARLVVLLYGMACVAVFYGIVRLCASRGVALIAALLLSLSLYPYHRTALGEAPGFFWLLLGGWLWLRALLGGPRLAILAMAGLSFGLAALTKQALAPIAAVTLLGSWSLAHLSVRQTDQGGERPAVRSLLVPLALLPVPLVAWYALQMSLLGLDTVLERMSGLSGYQSQFVELSWGRLQQNLSAATSSLPDGLAPWIAPAALLTLAQLLRGRLSSPARNFLPVLAVVCFGYYLLSVGWPRYGFWALAASTGLIAALAPLFLQEAGSFGLDRGNRLAQAGVPVLLGVALLAYPAYWTGTSLLRGDQEAPATARFVMEQTDADELLGTTEWEIDFLTKMRFKHPPTYIATTPPEVVERTFDWSWPGVDWVVVGPIGRYLGAEVRLASNPRFIERFKTGPYRVFQRTQGPAPGWLWSREGATATAPLSPESPVGQTFVAAYDVLNRVRVLLSGDGYRNNASVRVAVYDNLATLTPLATTELPGREIIENRWYGVTFTPTRLIRGKSYYLELTAQPLPGQRAPTAWYNDTVDHYPGGSWYLERRLRAGDLYFGVIGHNARNARSRQLIAVPGFFE